VICEFGDVVVVPFPFVELPIAKRRPALVLSNAAFNGDNGQTLLAMITTASRSSWPSDIPLQETETTGLSHRSFLRWKVFTLPNDAILEQIGTIGSDDKAKVTAATGNIFPSRS